MIIKNKILIIFAAVLAIILVAVAVISWYNYFKVISPEPEELNPPIVSKTPAQLEEEKNQKQLQELDELRKQTDANAKPLTQEEINKQLKEFDAYRKKSGVKPLTEEEIQKQLEELNKLRL